MKPSWKYHKELTLFEDHILFNYFEGSLDENIQLIDDVWELIKVISITPDKENQNIRLDNNSFILAPKSKDLKLQVHRWFIPLKLVPYLFLLKYPFFKRISFSV